MRKGEKLSDVNTQRSREIPDKRPAERPGAQPLADSMAALLLRRSLEMLEVQEHCDRFEENDGCDECLYKDKRCADLQASLVKDLRAYIYGGK